MSFTIFQNEKTPFQAIKQRSSKSKKKIDIFPKGLTHSFGPKMAIVPTFFFRQYRPGRCLLPYSRTKKTSFQVIKRRSSKSPKIDIFSKGLTHCFGPKMAIFPSFFFWQYGPGKCLLRYSRTKKCLSWVLKQEVSKSRKIDIFLKGLTHGFGPKMAIFQLFFQAIEKRKMTFTIFQNEKMPFQPTKTRSSKSWKIDIFLKGIPMVLVQKLPVFQLFFFCNIDQENVFYDFLERKKITFQARKKQEVQKVEKLTFF